MIQRSEAQFEVLASYFGATINKQEMHTSLLYPAMPANTKVALNTTSQSKDPVKESTPTHMHTHTQTLAAPQTRYTTSSTTSYNIFCLVNAAPRECGCAPCRYDSLLIPSRNCKTENFHISCVLLNINSYFMHFFIKSFHTILGQHMHTTTVRHIHQSFSS